MFIKQENSLQNLKWPCSFVICVCTYNRNELLADLLKSFSLLDLPLQCKLSVIVVDNFQEDSAKEVVSSAKNSYSYNVNYLHEPIKGIYRARNRALQAGLALEADYLAFTDDDCVVTSQWLGVLHRAMIISGKKWACGPVHAVKDAVNVAMAASRTSNNVEPKTHLTNSAATCNVIISSDIIQKLGLSFDEDFDLTGGGDRHFFACLTQHGYKGAEVSEILVYEHFRCDRFYFKARYRRFAAGMCNQLISTRKLKGKTYSYASAVTNIFLNIFLSLLFFLSSVLFMFWRSPVPGNYGQKIYLKLSKFVGRSGGGIMYLRGKKDYFYAG